jgi:hypothetical protein
MKAFLNDDVCINSLNVSLFDEIIKNFSHSKKLLILGLDLDPDPQLDPDLNCLEAWIRIQI